jgi:hypothetical protein
MVSPGERPPCSGTFERGGPTGCEMWRLVAAAGGLAALTACPGVDDDDDPGRGRGENPCGWDTACGDVDVDAPSIDMTWDAEGVTVWISGMDTTGFDFGIAETADGVNGWYGEDCLNGTLGYNLCHVFNNSQSGTLLSVFDDVQSEADLDLVVAGETTLFHQVFDGMLTYVVTIDNGECFVWGNDPSYYLGSSSFGSCDNLN